MMTSIPFSRGAFLGALPLLAGAISARAVAQSAPLLRVGAIPTDGFAEAYYAQDMGFFQKAGLNVELTTFTNGSAATTAVAGGAIDIGVGAVTAIANAVLHGVPFAYIAGGALYVSSEPVVSLAVAKYSPIAGPADFIGKTVAISALKDGTHLAMAAYLTRAGVDPSRVDFVEMPYPLMAGVVERGTVAGAVLVEPFATAQADQVKIIAKPLDAIAARFLLSGWFATRPWLAANADTAHRFVSAIYETARWANANRAKSGALLEKYSKTDAATIARMPRSVYADTLTARLLDPTLDWAARVKFVERRIPASELIA